MPGELLVFNSWNSADHYVTVEQFRCLDCGAWLSLGPANDEPAEVQVEIRAADRALNNPTPGADRFEFCPSSGSADLCDLCQEHLLAHVIATHDATHEHEEGE